MTGMPAWQEMSSAARPDVKVLVPQRPGDVIVGEQLKRQPIRNWCIKHWEHWQVVPTKAKVKNGITLAVITSVGGLSLAYIDPIFVFALTLVIRTLFYAFARRYVHDRAYEAAVATRSFAVVQAFAYLAVIIDIFESQAIWRLWAFMILAFLLTMEVIGIRTWYSTWMERERRQMSRMHPLIRAMSPKAGSLLTAFVCLIVEYVTFLIMWSRELDLAILFTIHVLWWIYHIVWLICHALVKLGHVFQHH